MQDGSCLTPLFMEERRNYLYLSVILWDSKRARSLSNLVECKVTFPYRSSSGLFISTTSKQKKMLPWQKSVARKISGKSVTRYKLTSSNLCRGVETKEIFIYKSEKQRKRFVMTILVTGYCRKANQLQSVQQYRMQRTNKSIYK